MFGGVPGSEGREAGKSIKEEKAKTLIHHLFGRFRTIQKGLVCASAYASNPRSVSHKFFKIAAMGLGLQKAYGVNPVEAATEQLVNPELHGFRIWIEWNDHLTSTATGIPLSG